MAARGATSAEIAAALHLSTHPINRLRSQILQRLGVHGLAGPVRWAVRRGLVSADEP